jgi:predicted transcriptional regulator
MDEIAEVDYLCDTLPTPLTDRRMKRDQNGTRRGAPKNLRALHHEIIRLTLLGWKQTEVARYLQITDVTVGNCLASYKGQNLLRMMMQKRSEATVNLQQVMVGNAPAVHDVWLDIILDPNTPTATRAKEAREYMGVCGYVKPQKIHAQTVHTHLTLEEIEQIKARARARAVQAEIIDVEGMERVGSIEAGGQVYEDKQ